jgi:hypothetical protein
MLPDVWYYVYGMIFTAAESSQSSQALKPWVWQSVLFIIGAIIWMRWLASKIQTIMSRHVRDSFPSFGLHVFFANQF